MKTTTKVFIVLTLLGAIFVAFNIGYIIGQKDILKTPPVYIKDAQSSQGNTNLSQADFSVFWQVWRRIENDYLEKEKLDYQKMIYGAVKGLVASLGDPYSTFFDPEETADFEAELEGKYQGVGMEVAVKNNKITVVAPLPDTPAEKAGLKPGDVILRVDDTDVDNLSLDEVVNLIRGKEGTEVKLLIERKDWSEPKTFILKRATIKIPTLKLDFKNVIGLDRPVAVMRIYQFNKILIPEMRRAYTKINKKGCDRIVLDLRNNPGGYLDVAQAAAGWFLPRGEVVVWQESSKNQKKKVYKSYGPSLFADWPVVVLINEGTASGAEVLAGALRDNRGVLLIGEKSFGKGSVQEQVFLDDGSSVKITIAHWLTPKGHLIDKKGLMPDVKVELTEEDWDNNRDPQLNKALEIIKGL